MHYQFSIIIVTWNALKHLKTFLPSVSKTEYSSFEIIIADNASNDGSAEWVKKHYPECRVVSFEKNYGYCGGNNRAAKHAKGDILLFLNNDVFVQGDWLNPLNRTFKENDFDILQPKILSYKNRGYFEYAGASGGYIDAMGYPFCRGRMFDTIEKDYGQYDNLTTVFWATGAAFAIRKDVFNQLGGFDEDFEFHMEEIDLCWRALKQNYKSGVQPKSIVYHLGGGSLSISNPRKTYYNFRNSLYLLTKNLDTILPLKIFFRLLLDGIAGFRFLLQGKPKETIAIIKAHFSFYRNFSNMYHKRPVEKMTETLNSRILYPRIVIFDYFLKNKRRFSQLTFPPNNKEA